ncbi:MAG: PAS domain S-box protein [Candidatus Wenzhouxiangella sp. M2_3B_020]
MSNTCTPVNPSQPQAEAGGTGAVRRLARAFEHSAAGIALLSVEGRWLEVNPAFCRLVGYERDALLGRSFVELTHADDVGRSVDKLQELLRGGIRSFGFDKRYVHADGDSIWVHLDVSMVLDASGDPDFIITQAHDVTARRSVRERLADREAHLRSVIRSMGEGVVVVDADGSISLANQRALGILRRDEDALRRTTLVDLARQCVQPDGTPFDPGRFPIEHTLATGRPRRAVPMRLLSNDGVERWIEISTEAVRDEAHDSPRAVVATFSDITERVRTEQALKDSEERLSLALEGAKLGMWDWDLEREKLSFNKIAERMLGFESGEIAFRTDSVMALAHPKDRPALIDEMEAHLRGARPFFEIDARMRRKSGEYLWTNLRGRVTERDGKRPLRVTGILIDISRRKELEREMQRLATTDELTGLLNRRRGVEILRREIDRSRRSGNTFSLILLDLDHFKKVNDRFGHDIGDRVLADVAGLLRSRLRRTDVAARWGGEEFALILPETDREGGRVFADDLLSRMREIRMPDGRGITASFGVVDYRQDESPSELVKRADRLMYRAKHAGRARVETESGGDEAAA